VNVNERPVVRLFGKTKTGQSVCGFYEGFLPFFYVRGDVEVLREHALKVEKVKKKEVSTNKEADFWKVTIANPARTPEFRDMARATGAEVLEADILFKYRFMNDLNVKGLGWVKAEGTATATNTVTVDKPFSIKSLKPLERDADAPLKTLAFDIECVPLKAGNVPESKKDPIIMISFAFEPSYKGKRVLVISTRRGEGTKSFDTEKEMLEEFVRIVNEYDADILTGFNCNNFDVPYILERMAKLNVRPVFGRCESKQVMARKLGARYRVNIAGRVIVDSYEIVKKDFSLQRYGLNFVSEALLGKKKDDVKYSEIEKLWKGSEEEYKRLVRYSRKDSELALDLVIQLQLLDKYIAVSKVAGTVLQDTLEGGETTRIENLLLKEFNKEGYVLPCKPDSRQIVDRDKVKRKVFVGGYVIEPEKHLHENVVVLDFKSMYPSIIRSFNICPTTISEKGVFESPSGSRFLSPKVRKGIVPRILQELMEERQEVKKKLKKASNAEKKRILYAKQWGLKILANAFYGYLGYSKARVFNVNVANSVTSYGRDIITKTAEKIQKKYGVNVVYGDTDSVFVVVPESDLDKIASCGTKIASELTKDLPGIMELEFEKTFKRFLPLTKKRYAAWKFTQAEKDGKPYWEEGMETKGIETVRRDWCQLVSETIGEVLDMVLKENNVKGAVSYFKNIVDGLVEGNVPIQKLVITKTMTKSPQNYAGMQPHIELVKKISGRNPQETPGVGDRIPYVIVKGTEMLSKRAEDPVFIVENGLQVDSSYYIENQLLPPLERIFSAMDISKSELLGNGKQMGIMDAFKPHKPAAHIKTVKQSDVTGYSCEKCSQFYPTTPLLGICKCGGRLLFASKKGTAKSIAVN